MGTRAALLLGNSSYQDLRLTKLETPHADIRGLGRVLEDRARGAFSTELLEDRPESEVRRTIGRFFSNREADDLVLFYFSGHGVIDEKRRLYLAVTDTDTSNTSSLLSSAISADFVRQQMDACRSSRQILILDCCHSGAFADAKAALGGSAQTKEAFSTHEGWGRVIMTATDATQYAWQGDRIVGSPYQSLFTRFLVEGLESGAADRNGNGSITIDDAYAYIHDRVCHVQRPLLWTYKQEGQLILAQNPNPMSRPDLLPKDLLEDLNDEGRSGRRRGAVLELESLASSSPKAGIRLAARELLEKVALTDDSTRVKEEAIRVLKSLALGPRQPVGTVAMSPSIGRSIAAFRLEEPPPLPVKSPSDLTVAPSKPDDPLANLELLPKRGSSDEATQGKEEENRALTSLAFSQPVDAARPTPSIGQSEPSIALPRLKDPLSVIVEASSDLKMAPKAPAQSPSFRSSPQPIPQKNEHGVTAIDREPGYEYEPSASTVSKRAPVSYPLGSRQEKVLSIPASSSDSTAGRAKLSTEDPAPKLTPSPMITASAAIISVATPDQAGTQTQPAGDITVPPRGPLSWLRAPVDYKWALVIVPVAVVFWILGSVRGKEHRWSEEAEQKTEMPALHGPGEPNPRPGMLGAEKGKENKEAAAPSSPKTSPEDDKTVYEINPGKSPSKGRKNAPLQLVIFSDFQCPFCKRLEPTLAQVAKEYGRKIRMIWKNYPLPFHNNAEPAAEAAMAAHAQGKFWQMHDILFANNLALDRQNLENYARDLGLDMTKFRSDLDAQQYRDVIKSDIQEAQAVGVSGTPTVFINGRKILGAHPFETFKKIADEELAK